MRYADTTLDYSYFFIKCSRVLKKVQKTFLHIDKHLKVYSKTTKRCDRFSLVTCKLNQKAIPIEVLVVLLHGVTVNKTLNFWISEVPPQNEKGLNRVILNMLSSFVILQCHEIRVTCSKPFGIRNFRTYVQCIVPLKFPFLRPVLI